MNSVFLDSLTRPKKFGLVIAGYVCALVVALGVVYAYVLATNTPDRITSSGMYAFGDSLVFLGAFAIAAVPATAAALYFLRPVRKFWTVTSLGALVIAATALIAALSYLHTPSTVTTGLLPALAPLRLLVAPVLGLAWLLALLLAPNRSSRRLFIAAAAVEFATFMCVAIMLWRATR